MDHSDKPHHYNGLKNSRYFPGKYEKQKVQSVKDRVEQMFKEWTLKREMHKPAQKDFPVICFSRKIGVGALEIADLLGEKIGYPVFDRQILEQLADKNGLNKELARFMEERCRSEIEDIIAMVFGEKIMAKSEYSYLLFKSILSLADLGPGIFVGRGAHLILPRERLLAVRLICSELFRVKRVASIMDISEQEAAYNLEKLDREQENFFKRIFDKKSAPAQEFDLVINCDFFPNPEHVADIVAAAFRRKFNIAKPVEQPA